MQTPAPRAMGPSGRTRFFKPIRKNLYGMFLSLLTIGTNIHGISESPFLPVGPDTPGTGDRPLHSAAARYLLDLRHPVSRTDRCNDLSLRRSASRHRTSPPVV